MMNFRPNKATRWSPLVGILLLVVLVVFVRPVREMGTSVALRISVPVVRVLSALGDVLFRPIAYVQSQERLLRENSFLRTQVELASEARVRIRALETENQALMVQAGRVPDEVATRVGVAPLFVHRDPHVSLIISRPVRSFYDTLMIDRGSDDGLRPAMTVFSLGGILLGEVETVLPHQSRVVLYSSSGKVTDVLIGKEQLAAVANGAGGGNLQVEVPHGAPIALGDTVVAIHDTPWVLGTVGAIDDRSSNTLARVRIKSPVNFQELKWVVVTRERLPEPILDYATATPKNIQ